MNNKIFAINKIKEIEKKINDSWNEIKNYDANKIKESWEGSLGDFYLDKFDEIDKTISLINSNLELLDECWNTYNEENL